MKPENRTPDIASAERRVSGCAGDPPGPLRHDLAAAIALSQLRLVE